MTKGEREGVKEEHNTEDNIEERKVAGSVSEGTLRFATGTESSSPSVLELSPVPERCISYISSLLSLSSLPLDPLSL